MPTIIHEHDLKINPYAYEQVRCGNKPFEVRNNDRGFQKGDSVILRCWENNCYNTSKPPLRAKISYVTSFAQKDGWCVFGMQDISEVK